MPGKVRLQRYLDEGLTQNQIVERWEKDSNYRVSRSAIAMAVQRYGLKSERSNPRYMDLLPWRLEREHAGNAEARLLRHEARRRSGGKLREQDEHWLDKWLEELNTPAPEQDAPDGWVVAYDPENEPDGFVWRPRRAHHTDIIDPPEGFQAS